VRTAAAEQNSRADDECSDQAVQQKGTREVDAELVAVAVVFAAELEVRSYGILIYGFNGWVTMLMLVMPACLTASITEAKAPNGTRSSARR
jgi:hypothetical protein